MAKIHTYKTADDMPVELLKGKSETLAWMVYEDNRPIVPVNPKITLKTSGQGDFPSPVVAEAMSASPSGKIFYAMTSANTGQIMENAVGTISYDYGGDGYQFSFLFDIVRSRLTMTITDQDLFDEFPALGESGYRLVGTASANGTTTTLVDTAQLIQPDDTWSGGTVEFPATGEVRSVTGFSKDTATLTFAPACGAATAASQKYIVTRSFRKERLRAFQDLMERLRNAGRRPALILDSVQLRTAHIFLTLSKIFRGFVNSEIYQQISRDYAGQFERAFDSLRLDYDENQDGIVSRQDQQGIVCAQIRRG